METKTGTKTGQITAVPNVRNVPLGRLSEHIDPVLQRLIPSSENDKLPKTAFDASL
jgi:hypothetical protein